MATVEASYGGITSFSSSPTISITAPASGNALLVCLGTGSAISITAVNDGSAYTEDFASAADARRRNFWSRFNVTDSPTTITLTLSGSANVEYVVLEVSGLASYDTGANGDTGAFTATPSASATSSAGNALGFAMFRITTDRTYTDPASGNWTRVSGTTALQTAVYYDADVGAAGSITCDPTLSSGANAYDSIALYNAAATGSSPSPIFQNYYSNLLQGGR